MKKNYGIFRELGHVFPRTGAHMKNDNWKPRVKVCSGVELKTYTHALLCGIQNRFTGRRNVKPQSVIRSTVVLVSLFQSIHVISAFSLYCPQRCLDVARYAFDIDVNNLLETSTNLTLILTTDSVKWPGQDFICEIALGVYKKMAKDFRACERAGGRMQAS